MSLPLRPSRWRPLTMRCRYPGRRWQRWNRSRCQQSCRHTRPGWQPLYWRKCRVRKFREPQRQWRWRSPWGRWSSPNGQRRHQWQRYKDQSWQSKSRSRDIRWQCLLVEWKRRGPSRWVLGSAWCSHHRLASSPHPPRHPRLLPLRRRHQPGQWKHPRTDPSTMKLRPS